MKEHETNMFDHMYMRYLTQIIVLSNTTFNEMEAIGFWYQCIDRYISK